MKEPTPTDGTRHIGFPEYRSHKVVRAARILGITSHAGQHALVLELDPCDEWFTPNGWVERHKPEVGGYLVLYADGYASYSPAAPFEEGYSRA